MLLSSPTRQNACYSRRRRQSDGCHCRRPSQTTPDRIMYTEFTQKIHHARHQAAQHHHHRPIGPRAVTTVFRPFGMLRPHGEQQMPRRRQHLLSRRQRQFFPGAVAIAMHLSTRNSSRGKRLLLAHPSIIAASAIARPLSSLIISSEHHQIV